MPKHAVVVGTLVKWNAARGFGFARRDHGEDVFVFGKDVRYSGINEDDLQVGMRLSFVQRPDEKPGRAARAIYIRIISGVTA
jgi:cold shock CspA family protein